jgi:ATP-dependent DNA helicase RecG
METNFIGSKLAELDLRLRGPGEISGTRQHGRTTLKIADLSDNNLIKKTLEAVKFVLNNLNTFPLLHEEMRIATINRGLLKRD